MNRSALACLVLCACTDVRVASIGEAVPVDAGALEDGSVRDAGFDFDDHDDAGDFNRGPRRPRYPLGSDDHDGSGNGALFMRLRRGASR